MNNNKKCINIPHMHWQEAHVGMSGGSNSLLAYVDIWIGVCPRRCVDELGPILHTLEIYGRLGFKIAVFDGSALK